MSCCCANPYQLSCGSLCDGLTIDYTSPDAATYSLVGNYYGYPIKINAAIAAGDKLIFDLSELAIMHVYDFKVLKDGKELIFQDVAENQYDCFRISALPFGSKAETVPLSVL